MPDKAGSWQTHWVEGNGHIIFYRNALSWGRTPAVNLNIWQVTFRSVNIADFFGNSWNIIFCDFYIRLNNFYIADKAVLAGERKICVVGTIFEGNCNSNCLKFVSDNYQYVVFIFYCIDFVIQAIFVFSKNFSAGRWLVFVCLGWNNFFFDFSCTTFCNCSVETNDCIFIIKHLFSFRFSFVNTGIKRIKNNKWRNSIFSCVLVFASAVHLYQERRAGKKNALWFFWTEVCTMEYIFSAKLFYILVLLHIILCIKVD